MSEQKNHKESVLFAKLREEARIPKKKKDEDGGWDVWASIPEDKVITIYPGQVKRIPTGVISAFDKKFVAVLKERSSTGTKGMRICCGVMDSGFRNEWFAPIQNTNQNVIIHIGSKVALDKIKVVVEDEWQDPDFTAVTKWEHVYYDTEKAICQFLLQETPDVEIKECLPEEVLAVESVRKLNMMGSTNEVK